MSVMENITWRHVKSGDFMKDQEVVEMFIGYAENIDKNAPNEHWYVGVTVDPTARKYQHENTKKITCNHFEPLVYYSDRQDAEDLEGLLGGEGFAIAKRDLVPIDETVESERKHYVYIFLAVKNE